jgi:mRNA interferase MazF
VVKKSIPNKKSQRVQEETRQTSHTASSGIKRGEIWLAVLDPTVGSEIQKTRPCLIISPPELHDHLRTVTVAPMTTGSRTAPFRIPLTFAGKEGLILLDQIRTLDKQRLVKRLGAINNKTLSLTLSRLREFFSD